MVMRRSVDRVRAAATRAMASGMVRATTILVGGAAAAHMITALALPVVTRLYQPQDMGTLAVFSSLLTIFSVSICLRFEIALSMPHDEEESANLFALGALSAVVLSALLALAIVLLPNVAYAALGSADFARFAWLLPPAVMVTGLYSLLQFWFVRRQSFRLIANSRMSQSAASAGAQIGLGLAQAGPVGLIVGAILNGGAGALILGARLWQRDRGLFGEISWRRMRGLFHEYRRYPAYSAPEALANAVGISLPVVVVAALAGAAEVGQLMLGLFVIQAPMSLLGNAVAQVYLSEAPARFRAGTLGEFTAAMVGGLLKAGVGPLLLIGILSPFAFGIVFGEDWSRAGLLVSWMTPWFVLHLLTAPISYALQIANRQGIALLLQVIGLFWRIGSVAIVGLTMTSFTSEAFAVSGWFFYFVYLALILRIAGSKWRDILVQVRAALPVTAAWIVLAAAGVLVLLLIRLLWQ